MKKLIAILITLTLLLCGTAALAETDPAAEGTKINCEIVEGSYVIQVDAAEGDTGWTADDMAQDDSVMFVIKASLFHNILFLVYSQLSTNYIL